MPAGRRARGLRCDPRGPPAPLPRPRAAPPRCVAAPPARPQRGPGAAVELCCHPPASTTASSGLRDPGRGDLGTKPPWGPCPSTKPPWGPCPSTKHTSGARWGCGWPWGAHPCSPLVASRPCGGSGTRPLPALCPEQCRGWECFIATFPEGPSALLSLHGTTWPSRPRDVAALGHGVLLTCSRQPLHTGRRGDAEAAQQCPGWVLLPVLLHRLSGEPPHGLAAASLLLEIVQHAGAWDSCRSPQRLPRPSGTTCNSLLDRAEESCGLHYYSAQSEQLLSSSNDLMIAS